MTETLNLPNFMDNTGMSLDAIQRAFEEEFYNRPYNIQLPFMCQAIQQHEGLLKVVEVEKSLLQDPTIKYLESEARVFVKSMLQHSESIEQVRRICRDRLEIVTKVSFMGTDDLLLKTYGSWENGLSIPGSDIDLLVSTPGLDKELAIRMLETLEENLREFSWVSSVRNISSA